MADKPTKLKNKETAFRSNEELVKQVEARIKKGNKVNQEESMQYIKAKGLKGQDLLDFYDKNMSQGFSMKNPSKWEREELDPNYKVPTTDADIKNWRGYNTNVESMKADSVPSQLKQYLINTGYAESNKFGSGDTLEGKRIYTRAKSVGINPEMDAEGNFKLADDVNTFKDTDKTFGKTRTINPKAKYVKKVYTKGNDIVNNYELAVPPTYEGKVPTEQELKDFDAGTFYQVGANSQYKKVYVPYLDPKKVPQDGDASTINANNQEMVNRYNTAQSYVNQMNAYKKTDEYKKEQTSRENAVNRRKTLGKALMYTPLMQGVGERILSSSTKKYGGTITTPREDMYVKGGTTDKPRFPGNLNVNQSDNTNVNNSDVRSNAYVATNQVIKPTLLSREAFGNRGYDKKNDEKTYNDYTQEYNTLNDKLSGYDFKKRGNPNFIPDIKDKNELEDKFKDIQTFNNGFKNLNKILHIQSDASDKMEQLDALKQSNNNIKLTKGRYNLGSVNSALLDKVDSTAKANNIDPYDILKVMGRESNFGKLFKHGINNPDPRKAIIERDPNSLRDMSSAWDNEIPNPLLEKKYNNVNYNKSKYGWSTYTLNEKQLNNEIKDSDIVNYKNKVDSYMKETPDALSYITKKIKNNDLKSYNPGDKEYINKLNEEKKLLMQEPNLAKYLKTNKFAGGGRVPIPVNNPNDPRLRAYNDSNTLYGVTSLAKKFLATKPTMEQWIDYANNENVDVTKAWNKLKKVNNKYPEPIKKEPVFLNSTTTGKKEEGALNYYKKPVQPYVYEKAKPITEQNIPQSIANQTSDFQPDMVQTNNAPNYDKTKLYQGYDFMQQTGLRPGDYTEMQVQEAMKNKGLPKKSLGGRVLPKFGNGGNKPGNWAGTDRSGKAIQTNFANSTAGENVVTGAGIAGAVVPMLTSFIPDDRITDSEGNEVGSKENMGKSILNSAAQGASMGAAAGPWGAAIGAGVGAIYGGVTNSMNNDAVDKAQQQANMRINNKNLSNKLLTNQNNYSVNRYNNDQMIAANGGTVIDEDMGNPNAELELNETFRDPMTGETGMVDGPSHDNGGIEMSLAEGTQIWSDRLKHNGRTFASLTKPIINKIAVLEKGTKDNPNSRFKQNSIQLLNSQLDFFFDKQESNKQQDEMKRTLKKQEGGVVDDMGNYHYANGGIYIKPENRNKMAMGGMMKHSMGGNVLPKFYEAGTFNDPETEPEIIMPRPPIDFRRTQKQIFAGLVQNNAAQNPGAFFAPSSNRYTANNNKYKKDAVSNYRDNQNADLAEVNNTLGAQMDQMNAASRNTAPITTNVAPVNTQEATNEMSNLNNAPLNNFDAQNYRKFMGNFKGDLKNIQGYKMGFGQPNENSWDNKGYTLGANGAAGDQYTFDKIGTPTYQEPTVQPQNNSGYRRNNTGELIQAGALAGSTFAQLNNINRQAAPGIRPDVRLTGAIPNPRYVDLSAERGAINRSALGAMEGAQRGFGNSATAQAFKNKARINQLQGLGQSFSNQEIANADIGNKFAGMRGDAAMKEAMMNNEIANTNLENKYQFNQNRMANQNAAIGTLGHGFGDIGRNRTMHGNEMEKVGIINNRFDKSAAALMHRDNQELTDQALANGTYTKEDLIRYGIPYKWDGKKKYGGTIKTRSLKY